MTITVEDDGDRHTSKSAANGRDPSPAGHGITGMGERARALGGELEAGPRARGGFRVRARLPISTGAQPISAGAR